MNETDTLWGKNGTVVVQYRDKLRIVPAKQSAKLADSQLELVAGVQQV